MFTERLQVRLSRTQRQGLEAEAKRRRISVSAVIREALDARFQSVPLERRLRAVAEIRAMRGGRFLTIGAIERIVDEERSRPLKT